MKFFIKMVSTTYESKSNLLSWEFKLAECEDTEFSNAIYEVEVCYNCSFTTYDIGTYYYIEAKLPDDTTYITTILKGNDTNDIVSVLKRDIMSEWEDRLLKF